jgi:cell division protein FtsW
VVIRDRTGDPTYYLERQAAAVLVGLVGMGLLSRVSTRTISRWAPSVYVACLIALGLVLIPGISHSANGATRWIGVGSLHLQPSEFCKLALILVLADRVARYPGGVQNFRLVLLPLFGIAAPAFVLVMLEPDFGTTALLGLVFGLVLYLGGIPTQWLLTLGVAGTGLAVPFVLYSDYRRDRILSWLNPWLVEQGDGYQVIQSWLALHSGGLTGQGIGGSLAKLHYLPEPWTDFIAAVIGEELGFLGIVALLGCYAFFLWRGVRIARRSRTFYGSIIAGAITLLIGVQAFLNLGVVTGMVPPKGLVLPFISYGSSAVLAHLFGVGLLLAISTESEDAVIEEASRKRHALEPDPTVQPLPQAPADDSGASP